MPLRPAPARNRRRSRCYICPKTITHRSTNRARRVVTYFFRAPNDTDSYATPAADVATAISWVGWCGGSKCPDAFLETQHFASWRRGGSPGRRIMPAENKMRLDATREGSATDRRENTTARSRDTTEWTVGRFVFLL